MRTWHKDRVFDDKRPFCPSLALFFWFSESVVFIQFSYALTVRGCERILTETDVETRSTFCKSTFYKSIKPCKALYIHTDLTHVMSFLSHKDMYIQMYTDLTHVMSFLSHKATQMYTDLTHVTPLIERQTSTFVCLCVRGMA